MQLTLHAIKCKGKESKVVFRQIATEAMSVLSEVQRSLTSIIFGGGLEGFPQLLIVSAENDTGWFPHYMYRLDHIYEKFGAMLPEQFPLKPGENVRRQGWVSSQDIPVWPAT